MSKVIRLSPIGVAWLLGMSACAPARSDFLSPTGPPIVWPEAPDTPRVRYLGELKSADDVRDAHDTGRFWRELLTGPQPQPRLITPHAVAVHDDRNIVAVADTNAHCVHLFDLTSRSYSRFERISSDGGTLDAPVAVCWVGEELWVADANLKAIVVYDPSAETPRVIEGKLQRPAGLAYCAGEDLVIATDSAAHQVVVFDRAGEIVRRIGSHGSGSMEFNHPSHVACAPDGSIVVSDSLNFRVQRMTTNGLPLGSIGRKGDAAGDFALPKGVAVDRHGHIWIVDAQFENIQAFTRDGQLLMSFGREGQGSGEFWLPAGICIDRKNRMWVADSYNRRVQVFELIENETN